jgi:hypothetical protein
MKLPIALAKLPDGYGHFFANAPQYEATAAS